MQTVFNYYPGGQLDTAVSPTIGLDFDYNARNQISFERVTSWPGYPGTIPFEIETVRDGAGNLTSLEHPDGTVFQYVPDALNRLDEVRDGSATTLVDLVYNSLSQMTAASFVASGAQMSIQYDDAGRVDIITHDYFASGGSPLSTVLDYTLDATGAVKSIDDDPDPTPGAGVGITYAYDLTKQLTQVDYPVGHGSPDPTVSWLYDDAGNRLQEVLGTDPGVDPTTDYTPNALNQYGTVGVQTQQHDANGNLEFDGAFTYHWDAENQLDEVRDATDTTTIATYAYDPFGRRVQKTEGGADRWFVWNGDRLLEERDDLGTLAVRYTYGPGFAPIQVRLPDGQGGEDVYDVHTDHLDTPRRLTDSSGETGWSADYAAFGEAFVDASSSIEFNIRFPGQYFDTETGLHYNRFRYYDASIGRYISADPIGLLGGLNQYGYAFNQPLSFVDYYGLEPSIDVMNAINRVRSAVSGLPKSADEAAARAVEAAADRLASSNPLLSEDPDGVVAALLAAKDKSKALADACQALLDAANEVDPAGGGDLKKAGRAIDKKQGQSESNGTENAFPTPVGNAASKNQQGESVVNEIARDPGSTVTETPRGGVDITDSSGRTMRFNRDGSFSGFRQPGRNR